MCTLKLLPYSIIFVYFSCVDRLQFDIDLPQALPVSVSGHISNQPGPYRVYLNSSFDIESKSNPKNPVSAKHVNLLDELGNDEELVEVETGVYQTTSTQGRVCGVYKIRIEFNDDRVYESIPDTLLASGAIDSLYSYFTATPNYQGAKSYGFDVYVNAHGNEFKSKYYMWSMTGTFKSLTHPEYSEYPRGGCYPILEDRIICNFVPPCTGLRNLTQIGGPPLYTRVAPCECCTCWYKIFNTSPILSDDFNSILDFRGISIYRVPLDSWIFMFKIHVEVAQSTLTKNSFLFFKSIKDQREAVGSLFQPITGKIPATFIQLKGATMPITGIFYAKGVHSKYIYITPEDIPAPITVTPVDYSKIGSLSCLELFPNATNIKPDFWKD